MKINFIDLIGFVKNIIEDSEKFSKFKEIIEDIKELIKDIKDASEILKG